MNILDIILLLCFIPALIQGMRKGFISQAIAIIAVVVSVWVSFEFATMLGEWIGQWITASEQVLKVIAFALILIGVSVGINAVGRLLEGIINIIMLRWLNKLLGAVFALMKAGLIVGLVIMAVTSLNNTFHIIPEEFFQGSVIYPPIKDMAYTVFPYLKEMFFWN